MRLPPVYALSFCRSLRRRAGAPSPAGSGILDEGATFSDVHSVILDPTRKLPYPDEQLYQHLEKTSKELLKERNKARYGNKKRSSNGMVFDHIPIVDQIVLLFPGQGSQYVGMGSKLMDSPPARAIFDQANEFLGYDLAKLCSDGPQTKLDQTLYCQPAVFVSSVAAFEKFKADDPESVDRITDVAGFSVGEYAALVAGGMLSFQDALRIVSVRCASMHECNQLIRSGMMTVRVTAASRLDDLLKDARDVAIEAGEMDVCEVANYLFCGVRVIGASETCMRFIEEHQDDYKVKVVKRLAVSGAFHTRQMEGAVDSVRKAVAASEILQPICNVYSNYSGTVFPTKKSDIRAALFKQVTHPVKWEQIQQLLYRKHQDLSFPRYVEVGAGRQLGAMLLQTSKKAYQNYEHFSC